MKMKKEIVLNQISTSCLVEELKKREGVETKVVEPYKNQTIKINGPAVVLVVID